MSTQGRSSTAARMVRPAFIAGVAVAGAALSTGGQGNTGSPGGNGNNADR